MDEYDGRQYVGIDLHRRRSVIVRMTPEGERLGPAKRIINEPWELAREVASEYAVNAAEEALRAALTPYEPSAPWLGWSRPVGEGAKGWMKIEESVLIDRPAQDVFG